MKTLIIRSSEWLRSDPLKSRLFDITSNTFCCLGLHAREYGIDKTQLSKCLGPSSLANQVNTKEFSDYFDAWLEESYQWSTQRASDAMEINDDRKTTDDEKIALLRPIFAEVGIEIDWRPNE